MPEQRTIAHITLHKSLGRLAPMLEYADHPTMNHTSKKQTLLALRDRIAAIPGITNVEPSIPDDFFSETREISAAYVAQFQHLEIVARVLILEGSLLILELQPERFNDLKMPQKAVKALLTTLPLA